jgi:hypothetical protein
LFWSRLAFALSLNSGELKPGTTPENAHTGDICKVNTIVILFLHVSPAKMCHTGEEYRFEPHPQKDYTSNMTSGLYSMSSGVTDLDLESCT